MSGRCFLARVTGGKVVSLPLAEVCTRVSLVGILLESLRTICSFKYKYPDAVGVLQVVISRFVKDKVGLQRLW